MLRLPNLHPISICKNAFKPVLREDVRADVLCDLLRLRPVLDELQQPRHAVGPLREGAKEEGEML